MLYHSVTTEITEPTVFIHRCVKENCKGVDDILYVSGPAAILIWEDHVCTRIAECSSNEAAEHLLDLLVEEAYEIAEQLGEQE